MLQAAVAGGEARLLVRPSTETLAALYTGAAAFAFPSWIEGFGIPLLEAMTYGAPIVASDRGAIPEVAGDAALFVDAEDDAALADALQRVLGEPRGRRAAATGRGRPRRASSPGGARPSRRWPSLRRAHARRAPPAAAR